MSLRAARRRANRVQGPVAQNRGQRQLMRRNFSQVGRALVRQVRGAALSVLTSLTLVAVTTIALLILDQFFALRHVTLVYLVPVVIAATKLGIGPAVIAAVAGVGASAFFFYPPIYSFLVEDPQHVIELPLFVFVAVVTGHLARRPGRVAVRLRRSCAARAGTRADRRQRGEVFATGFADHDWRKDRERRGRAVGQ